MMDNEENTRRRTDVDDGGTTRLVQADIHATNEVFSDKQHAVSGQSDGGGSDGIIVANDSTITENAVMSSGKAKEGNSKSANDLDGRVVDGDDDVQHMVEFDRTGVDGSGDRCSTASLAEMIAHGFTAGVVIVLVSDNE